MPLQDSPSFNDTDLDFDPTNKKASATITKEPAPASKYVMTPLRIFLVAAIAICLGILVIDLVMTNKATSSVTGVVLDQYGNPVEADVFIIGMEDIQRTDSTGYFELAGLREGLREVAVGHNGVGHSVGIYIPLAGEADAGVIMIDTTEEDG